MKFCLKIKHYYTKRMPILKLVEEVVPEGIDDHIDVIRSPCDYKRSQNCAQYLSRFLVVLFLRLLFYHLIIRIFFKKEL